MVVVVVSDACSTVFMSTTVKVDAPTITEINFRIHVTEHLGV